MKLYLKHWRYWWENITGQTKIRYLDLCPLWTCDARCPTCGAWQRDDTNLSFKQMDWIINHKFFRHVRYLIIEGGEPTLWEKFPAFVFGWHYAHPKCTIAIITNGFETERIRKQAIMFKEFQRCIRYNISLNGIGKTHDASRGRKGVFDKTVATAKMLKEMGYIVTFSFVPFQRNHEDYEAVVELGNSLGIYTDVCYPCDSGKFGDHITWKPVDKERLREISDTKKRGRKWLDRWTYDYFNWHVERKALMPCWAGKGMAHINPQGVIRPCSMDETMELGRIYDDRIDLTPRLKKIPESCQYASGDVCNQCYIFWSVNRSILKVMKWKLLNG